MQSRKILQSCLVLVLWVHCIVISAGDLITYTDEQLFNSKWPNLLTETFEEADVEPNAAVACSSPLSSTTMGDCFRRGDIIEGLTISDLPGPQDGGIAAFGVGWMGLPSKMVAPNIGNDRLNLEFVPPVNVVGLKLHTWGDDAPDTPTVRVYDPSDALIGQFLADSSVQGDFLGMETFTPIGRIEIESMAELPEVVDDIRFTIFDVLLKDGFEQPVAEDDTTNIY